MIHRGIHKWLNSQSLWRILLTSMTTAMHALHARRGVRPGVDSGPRSAPVPLLDAIETRGVDLGPLLNLILCLE